MPIDIETQLRRLGQQFRSEMTHVHPDEILDDPHASVPVPADRPLLPVEANSPTPIRVRWLTAVAAGLVLVLIGGLITLSERNGTDVGVNNQPRSCAELDYPVSFDGFMFPAPDSDIADTGYLSAEAAADAYLADRTRAVSDGVPISVSYEVLDRTSVVGPNTIVRATLREDTARGTVDIAARAIQTTRGGTRWVVDAGASDVSRLVVADFADERVTVEIDPFRTGTHYATINDSVSGVVIDATGTQTAGGSTSGSAPAPRLDLDTGGQTAPLLRYWFVNADTIEFAEVQLNQGYPDYGEGWQSLERLQLC